MPSPQTISLNANQREFFKILARRMRDVGYLSMVIAVMTIAFNLIDFSLQLSFGGRVDDAASYLSSYLSGNRSIDWSRVFLVLVEAPIGLFIGYWLVQGSKYFATLYGEDDPDSEFLMNGLLHFKKVIEATYIQILFLFGFIWLIIFFD
jgi:hypothetical protein